MLDNIGRPWPIPRIGRSLPSNRRRRCGRPGCRNAARAACRCPCMTGVSRARAASTKRSYSHALTPSGACPSSIVIRSPPRSRSSTAGGADDDQVLPRPRRPDVQQPVQLRESSVGSSTRTTTGRSRPLKRRIVSHRIASLASSGIVAGGRAEVLARRHRPRGCRAPRCRTGAAATPPTPRAATPVSTAICHGGTPSSTRSRCSTLRSASRVAASPSASISSGARPSSRSGIVVEPAPGEPPHDVVDRLRVPAVLARAGTPAARAARRRPRGRSPGPGRGTRTGRPRGHRTTAPRATAATRARSPGPRRRRSRGSAGRAAPPPRRAHRAASVPPGLRNGVWPLPQHAGLAAEVLAQLMERVTVSRRCPRRRLGQSPGEHPRERGVEADEQRREALAGEASSLLRGEHRLAGPGPTDDRRPADAAERVQQLVLRLRSAARPRPRRRRSRGAASTDLERLDQGRARSRSMAARPGAGAPGLALHSANARSRNARAPRPPSSSSTNDDWSAMRSCSASSPSSPSRPRIVSRSTLGNATASPAIGFRPAGQSGSSSSLRTQRVPVVGGLLERRPIERFGPAHQRPVLVAPDLAGLDLEHEDPALRVADDDVRLALLRGPVIAQQQVDVRRARATSGVHDRPQAARRPGAPAPPRVASDPRHRARVTSGASVDPPSPVEVNVPALYRLSGRARPVLARTSIGNQRASTSCARRPTGGPTSSTVRRRTMRSATSDPAAWSVGPGPLRRR